MTNISTSYARIRLWESLPYSNCPWCQMPLFVWPQPMKANSPLQFNKLLIRSLHHLPNWRPWSLCPHAVLNCQTTSKQCRTFLRNVSVEKQQMAKRPKVDAIDRLSLDSSVCQNSYCPTKVITPRIVLR